MRCGRCVASLLSSVGLNLECPRLSPRGVNYTIAPRALRTAWQGNFPTVSGVSEAQFQFLAVEWW